MQRILVSCLVSVLAACGGGRAPQGPAGPSPTTLSEDAPPVCGDYGRPYVAPRFMAGAQPAQPAPGGGHLGPLESRIAREGASFQLYAAPDQELIRSGRARVGLDEQAVYVAHGLPAFYWNVDVDGQPCRVMLYSVLGGEQIDTSIYVCNGIVGHIAPVQPQLPCWRLSEVAPRAIERAPHFDGRGIDQEWNMLYGLLSRGQTADDVYIAFGEPYRTGMEAREDGTNATTQVYLDSTGDAYGAYLTFVDGHLVSWRFPPDRQLTAEAEQRRLDAMEQRMMDQLREMEARSIARHQQEMQHLNDIQANQQQIRDDIQTARSSILDAVNNPPPPPRRDPPPPAPGAAPQGGGVTQAPPPSGCRSLTINGTRYSDHNGTPFGQACGDASGGCPDGYSCLVVGGGSRGNCVPHPDRERCN